MAQAAAAESNAWAGSESREVSRKSFRERWALVNGIFICEGSYSVIVHLIASVLASRTSFAAFLVLTLIASARIAATYTVFNETVDEPAHIACGMEWLDKGVYRYEPQHPPLARVMTAIAPYLAGSRATGPPGPRKEGPPIPSPAGN